MARLATTRVTYYLLGSFALITILVSLGLNERMTRARRLALAANSGVAALIAQVGHVEELAADVDSPGNDVFENGDVAGESAHLEAATVKFSTAMKRLRSEFADDEKLTLQTDKIDRAASTIIGKAKEIFNLIRDQKVVPASVAAAQMDRAYRELRAEMARLRLILRQRQTQEFQKETATLHTLGQFQWALGAVATALMIALFAHGKRLQREAGAALQRERHIEALQVREEALRRSEERFQMAVRATRDVVWEWDLLNQTAWFSEAFSSIHGYPNSGSVPISVWYDAIHPDDIQRVSLSLQGALEGGASFWTAEYRFRTANGAWREVFDRGYIIRDGEGKALRMIGAIMDVSERKAVERLKNEFVSTVSHELRTPLTSIRGALGLLASGRLGMLPEKGQRMLEIAANNTDRLVRLINDILDIERIESGKVMLAKKNCNAADLVRQAVDTIRQIAERERIHIVTELAEERLVGDPDRIIQTLTNLLGNAVKFSPPQSTIRVSVQKSGSDVVFEVADRGRGIPSNKLESIFERFQQVDASDSRDKGGSGLGLAICRAIVQQHGGKIAVKSEKGAGSTFTFAIPKGIDEPFAWKRRRTILICDDEEDARDAMRLFLENRGYDIRDAVSGQDLIAIAASDRPDAILLDLFMPDMNGWEALERLKSDPATSHIPVVIVSVLSPEETGASLANLSGWLQKPLSEKSLAAVVDQALRTVKGAPRVMLVEDDLDLARVISASFERFGIQIVHAANGKQAIELAQHEQPDLLILDLILPDVDGFAVVDFLKDHDLWRAVPLVVYSALEPTPSQKERLRLGHTEFLTKSRVPPEEFESRILSLLDVLTDGKEQVSHVA
jgi:PAS domain S-box-containing protein